MEGLIRLASTHLDCSPWILIRPDSDQPVFLDAFGRHGLDALNAYQVGELARTQFPKATMAGSIHPVWGTKLIELMGYQFDVSGTTALAVVWAYSNLLAVIGFRPRPKRGAGAIEVVHLLADAYRHLHDVEVLRQERNLYRYLTEDIQEALAVIGSAGAVMGITPSAVEILHSVIHGRKRPNSKDPMILAPSLLAKTIRENRTSVTLTKEITALVSYPTGQGDTVEPHALVRLVVDETCASEALEDGIRQLTPGQRAVYRLLLDGCRSKEIAVELGVSEHTIRHHITAILQKTGCLDKIQLITRVGKLPKRQLLTVPALIDAPVPPNTVPPPRHKKGDGALDHAVSE